MKLMRNREVQRLLLLCLLGTALIAAAGFCAGIVPGVLALAGGLVLSGGVMGVTLRRYRAIAQLNQDIDRVLHGEESLPIVSNDEGELAILRSEVGKMTIRLREAADSQRRERLHLADAMADISHQLRTPLTALNLTVTLLAAEDITPERRRELMRELRRLLSRMDWLVESLLKMSKLDAGTIPFQRMPLSAAELVRRAAAPLAVPMEVRGEHLETDVGGEMLLCDPGWTVEALGNVLKNCMEHAQSVVRVGARETALYTEITVRDDGPGMDPDDIPHLFERFYRGKNANQESFGIGLALSRAILAAQNGTNQQIMVEEQLPNAKLELVTKIPDGVNMVKTGRVDALAVPKTVYDNVLAENDDLEIADFAFDFEGGNYIASVKGEKALAEKIQELINQINAEGLYQQWLDEIQK